MGCLLPFGMIDGLMLLSPRDIHREGFHLKNVVADLIVNGTWAWPLTWLSKAPNLGLECLEAWEAIRAHGNQVTWSRIVWFSHNILCHAFYLWLVMRNGLKTHDQMKQLDIGPNGDLNALRCALCESQPDSHPHLFFECVFSSKVLSYICVLADIDLVHPNIHDIILYLQPLGNKRTARSIFAKLIVAATTYFLWNERNNRTFKKIRSPEEVRDIIMVTVRLKLLTIRFKNFDSVRRDENPIRTLGDYSKPSHEGYRNTIELLVGNNVLPLRSNTIQLVQNGCSFYGLRSEDPNQHLKDFLKLRDSLNLDASNWLERLPAGSITTWEDLTTRFLAQLFPPKRTAKLRNDILIRTIDQSAGGNLRDRNTEESWALLKDLALYDNESWNDSRDFAKLVKAITLPQNVPSTSDRYLIELENQVQRLMETHLALTQPIQVNKITTSCEICSGPHNTQYCMKDPKQAFF
ncbi:MAK10-like protein [Tanacetum coccineum]